MMKFLNRIYEKIDCFILVPCLIGTSIGGIISFLHETIAPFMIGFFSGWIFTIVYFIIYFILCFIESKNK